MTYQEIEQIKDATYEQTTRWTDNMEQYTRDIDGMACRVWGEVLQTMEIAEKAYNSSYSEEMQAAMWDDMFNFVKNQAESYFGYYAAKCEEHGKEKR